MIKEAIGSLGLSLISTSFPHVMRSRS